VKTDKDMYLVKDSEKIFDNKEVVMISAKFRLAGAIVKNNLI
jgi:hypothetical protein